MNVNKNSSGYNDFTAGEAISHADKEYERLTRLVKAIKTICDLSGFKIEGRIVLVDKKTGKIWR